MKYLTTKDPDTGLTPVDVYIEKQKAWGFAQSEWNAAKINAQSKLMFLSLACTILTKDYRGSGGHLS